MLFEACWAGNCLRAASGLYLTGCKAEQQQLLVVAPTAAMHTRFDSHCLTVSFYKASS